MTQTYNLQTVRELLTAAFDAREINTLAFDLFRPVYDDFVSGMTKGERILRIVDYAVRHGRILDLLAYVEKENPYQYGRFADQLQLPAARPEKPAARPASNSGGWPTYKSICSRNTTCSSSMKSSCVLKTTRAAWNGLNEKSPGSGRQSPITSGKWTN